MKERLLDVIKWGLILIIAGAVFYVVCPKYYFTAWEGEIPNFKCNKITGKVKEISIVFKEAPKQKKAKYNIKKDHDIFDKIAEEEARKKSDPLGILKEEDFKKLDPSQFPDQPDKQTKSKP